MLVEDREASQDVRLLAQAIVQILQPLAGPKVGEAVRKTVNEMFGVFAQSMAAAFRKFMRPDGTFPPRLGAHGLPPYGTPSVLLMPCKTFFSGPHGVGPSCMLGTVVS